MDRRYIVRLDWVRFLQGGAFCGVGASVLGSEVAGDERALDYLLRRAHAIVLDEREHDVEAAHSAALIENGDGSGAGEAAAEPLGEDGDARGPAEAAMRHPEPKRSGRGGKGGES